MRASTSGNSTLFRWFGSRRITLHWIAHWIVRWITWWVGIAAFVLYAYAAAPGIVTFFDDTLEFQTVAATWGIAHPTGYPLYTIMGALWARLLPIGTWAGRLNLMSALAAAIAVGLVANSTSRLVTDRAHTDRKRPEQNSTANLWAGIPAAIGAATTFALGPVWSSQATVAEVYALHGAFVAAILATTIGINHSPHMHRRMTWLMLLFGLGLTHHRTTLLIAPPVALYLLWSVPNIWRPRRVWWQWGAVLLLPLLLYLYIPMRAAAGVQDLNGSYMPTWTGFWDHVLARRYGAFFADNELTKVLTLQQWLELIRAQMGWMGILLAVLGLPWLVDRRWRPARAWWLVFGVLLINWLFAILYRVPDPEVFLLPTLLCLAIFAGGGIGLLARLLPSPGAWLLTALLAVLLVVMPFGRAPLINRHDMWKYHDRARRLAQANFPPNSQVIGLEGEMTALRYMQAAEALGINAIPITANDPAHRRALVENAVTSGTPVYLTREVEGIADSYSFSGDATLVRVWPRGQSQTALSAGAEVVPGMEPIALNPPLLLDEGRVQIEAYSLRPLSGLAQPAQELTLFWRVNAPTDKVLKLSLRHQDSTGTPYEWPADQTQASRAAIEDHFPLRGVVPIPTWLPGELIQDVHTLQLPPTIPLVSLQAKSAILLVIIYDSATALEEGRIEIKF